MITITITKLQSEFNLIGIKAITKNQSNLDEEFYRVASMYNGIQNKKNWDSDIENAMKNACALNPELKKLRDIFLKKSLLNLNNEELCARRIFGALARGC